MNIKRVWVLGLAAIALLAIYGRVLAQQQPFGGGGGGGPGGQQGPGSGMRKPPGLSFDEMDANHDGQATFEEFFEAHRALLTQRFNLMDTNQDKMITKDEMEAGARERSMRPGGFGPMKDHDRPPFDLGNPPEEQPDAQN